VSDQQEDDRVAMADGNRLAAFTAGLATWHAGVRGGALLAPSWPQKHGYGSGGANRRRSFTWVVRSGGKNR